jgi:hypothetical protein
VVLPPLARHALDQYLIQRNQQVTAIADFRCQADGQ